MLVMVAPVVLGVCAAAAVANAKANAAHANLVIFISSYVSIETQ
jgi:hypothetical protein